MEKANPHPEIQAKNKQEGIVSYIFGDDPSKWRTNIPTFSEVYYKGVYAGIDLRFYAAASGGLEYDFIVHPGGNPADIKVAMDGVKNLTINQSGDLIIASGWGEIRQKTPKIYQIIEDKEVKIHGGFYILGNYKGDISGRSASLTYGFEVGFYDRQEALVLDPAIVYSTILGGNIFEEGSGIAVDASGNA